MVWLKILGLPCYAWGIKLFKIISEPFDSFIKCDDSIITRVTMDEAKFLIKTSHRAQINEECIIIVYGVTYNCFLKDADHSSFSSAAVRFDRDEEESEVSSSLEESNSFREDSRQDGEDSLVQLTKVFESIETGEEDTGGREAIRKLEDSSKKAKEFEGGI